MRVRGKGSNLSTANAIFRSDSSSASDGPSTITHLPGGGRHSPCQETGRVESRARLAHHAQAPDSELSQLIATIGPEPVSGRGSYEVGKLVIGGSDPSAGPRRKPW